MLFVIKHRMRHVDGGTLEFESSTGESAGSLEEGQMMSGQFV